MRREACHRVYVEVRGQVDRVGSPTMWVLGIELRSSGLTANAFCLSAFTFCFYPTAGGLSTAVVLFSSQQIQELVLNFILFFNMESQGTYHVLTLF